MTRIPTPCPTCGKTRYLRSSDAKKTKQCRHCHLKAIAPLGFQAAAEKHGRNFAIDKAREWQLANPSSLEQIVAEALSRIPGITWEREYEVRYGEQTWYVDFVVNTSHHQIAIEIQSDWVKQQQTRTRPNKIKIRTGQLRCCFDELIFLDESDITSPGLAHRLSGLLGQAAAACQ
jgi:predicted AAA+ superfamily ATPase